MTRPPNVATERPGIAADDPRHGTSAGYIAGCRSECCWRAKQRYDKVRRLELLTTGRYRTVSNVGSIRRIQALQYLGWSVPKIAEHVGISDRHLYNLHRHPTIYTSTAAAIAAAYERLAMQFPPETTTGERISAVRARNHARRNGWLPPLAWDDIDDIDEQPQIGRDRRVYRSAELAAEWDHLRRCGVSIDTAARQLGVSVGAIEKAVERAGKEVAA